MPAWLKDMPDLVPGHTSKEHPRFPESKKTCDGPAVIGDPAMKDRARAYVYILECADGTFYTGWTNDLDRRVRDHNTPGKGAKYTRGRMPCRLIYHEEFGDKESAMRREWEIKHRLSRAQKEQLIRGARQTGG